MMMMMMALAANNDNDDDNDNDHDDDNNCSEAIICIPSSYVVHNFDFKLQQVSFTSRLSPLQQYDKYYCVRFKIQIQSMMIVDFVEGSVDSQ